MMNDRSVKDTEPGIETTSPPKRRRFLTLDNLVGFLLGLMISLIIGFALWTFGFVELPGEGCPENATPATCPETSVAPPICPTCAPSITTPIIQVVTATLTSSPTSTATPTPDIAATATAACITFESQFPATPCP